VLVEKPLSLSMEEGRQLVALACERQRVLMVGHLLWYHPAVLKLRALVEEGELGRIQYIYAHRLNLGKIRREENILLDCCVLGDGRSPHVAMTVCCLANK